MFLFDLKSATLFDIVWNLKLLVFKYWCTWKMRAWVMQQQKYTVKSQKNVAKYI